MSPDLLVFAQMVQFHSPEPFFSAPGMPWYAWVAIIGIVSGCITGVVSSMIRHRERMAMIQLGMHPDAPPPPASEPTGKPLTRETAEF